MTTQAVERRWAMMKRHLPLLEFLEGKQFGLVIVQLHGGRAVKMGYLPRLEAEAEGLDEFQDNKLEEECHGSQGME